MFCAADVFAGLGEVCEGFNEFTGEPFPECEPGLECVDAGLITIPGAGNVCSLTITVDGEGEDSSTALLVGSEEIAETSPILIPPVLIPEPEPQPIIVGGWSPEIQANIADQDFFLDEDILDQLSAMTGIDIDTAEAIAYRS